jgi:hypothetical protein
LEPQIARATAEHSRTIWRQKKPMMAIGHGRACQPGANHGGNTLGSGPSLRATRTVSDDPTLPFSAFVGLGNAFTSTSTKSLESNFPSKWQQIWVQEKPA